MTATVSRAQWTVDSNSQGQDADEGAVVVHVKCSHAAARDCAGENDEGAHTRKS
jgi:hypothetical protein